MNCSQPTSAITIELIKIALPFLAAVAGWFVASRFQDKRERRKEIRSIIEEAKKCIEKSFRLTLEYYSSSNKSPISSLSAEIKFNNMLISQYFIILNSAGLKTGGSAEIIAFQKLSTGDVFETKNYRNRINNPDWKAEITAASHELMFLLEKRYFDQFKIRGMSTNTM